MFKESRETVEMKTYRCSIGQWKLLKKKGYLMSELNNWLDMAEGKISEPEDR